MKRKLKFMPVALLLLFVVGFSSPISTKAETKGKKKMFLRVCFGQGSKCEIKPNNPK